MPKIKITSSFNGNITSVKEYDVSDEQAVKVQEFFDRLQARKETIRTKYQVKQKIKSNDKTF